MIKQIIAMTHLSIAGMPERKWTALSAMVAIMLVVLVLLGTLALATGFERIVRNSGSDNVAILLQDGAVGESNSVITRVQQDLLEGAAGIAQGADGRPAISRELYVVVEGVRRGSTETANLALRGVDTAALLTRDNVRIVEGRMLRPGGREIVVGSSLAKSFSGLEVGKPYRIGGEDWDVVGVFATGGGVFDSELWADTTVLQSLLRRGTSVQSMRVRLDGPEGLARLRDHIQKDSRMALSVRSERAYYDQQAKASSDLIKKAGLPLILIMALGALAGAVNAMNASAAARAVEINTVRRLGFGRTGILVGALVESFVIGCCGAALGIVLGGLIFDGRVATTLGSNFTQTVFDLSLTFDEYKTAFWWAVTLGLLGGIAPAFGAALRKITEAERE